MTILSKFFRRKKKTGPFWGLTVERRPKSLFVDYASNSMTVAPAGSGKGVSTVVPMGMAIRDSKVCADFKGELGCLLKESLEKRGENVRILNPGNLWSSQLGKSDSFNPIDIIVDDLHRPGGLRDVTDDLRELSMQLYGEPSEGESENTYFRNGSRRGISLGVLDEAVISEYDATLSDVSRLLEDRKALEYNLRWILGVDLEGKSLPDGPMPIEQADWAKNHSEKDLSEFITLLKGWASNWLALMCGSDSRTFDSFISGAQQALEPYAFGRLAPAMGRSTFSMDDLKSKDQSTTLFIVADASRPETYGSYTGLIQWCAMTSVKRHPNKAKPVFFIMDEGTNYKVHQLESTLTWGRSYGVRLHIIFQSISAFEQKYGEKALETLLSETEIKQFLPGQRCPRTLELIEKLLGNQSVMMASLTSPDMNSGLEENMSESERPLMTTDEIRRCPWGILVVRQSPPLLTDPITYAEIHPWREQVGINPFHGKPFLRKVRLKL